MMNNNDGLKAFLLGLIPGFGHLYLRKFGRGFVYPFAIIMIAAVGFVISVANSGGMPFFIALFFDILIWLVSLFDLVITIFSRQKQASVMNSAASSADEQAPPSPENQGASGTAIALAFIPGLGHMHMGLMYRGLTFLIGFFGVFTMVFFITALVNSDDFLIFLAALPIIWVYNLFDAMQLYHRKNKGETLMDRTIFEDLLEHRDGDRKSKVLVLILSLLPGAGHMYLGLQKRGLQLMAAFLLSIYILDILHLSLFLFLIPILWCFSFFDALQQVSKHEQGKAVDEPIVDWFIHHQRWVGIGLLLLGLFYIFDSVLIPALSELFRDLNIRFWYNQYFQTTVVSLVLIIGGIVLLTRGKKKKGGV